MSYTRPQRFEPGAFLRQCDLCGIRYRSTQLVRGEDNFWRCRQYCIEVPPITRDRISAQSQRRREAPPPKWGLPYDQKDAYTEEETAFNFLVVMPIVDASWPGGVRMGAAPANNINAQHGLSSGQFTSGKTGYTFVAINETCRYLYNLIVENRRSSAWIARAKVKLRELADVLLTTQNTSGSPDTNVLYGGFDVVTLQGTGSHLFAVEDQGGAGLSLLYAYLVHGDFKYLGGARATANIVRAFQWSAFTNTFFTSADSAGTVRLNTGGHSRQLRFDGVSAYLFDSTFRHDSLIAVEFLSLLKSTDGDAQYGGLGAIGTHTFVTTSLALLSTMIIDALAFWKNGVFDNFSSTTMTSLASITPREIYNAFPATKPAAFGITGTGNWEFAAGGAANGYRVNSSFIGVALRSLFFLNGFDAQVSDVWKYFTNIPSDPNPVNIGSPGTIESDFEIQSTLKSVNPIAPPVGQGNIIAPSYNPKICMTGIIQVRDPVTFATRTIPRDDNNQTLFWPTSGMLAGIQSIQDSSSFRKAKDILVKNKMRIGVQYIDSVTSAQGAGRYPINESALMRGATGLAFQFSATANVIYSVSSIAPICNVFRFQPQGFISEGRPDKTQPGSSPGTMQD